MADNRLRELAKSYFKGRYDRDTYLQQRTQLIDKITEESILSLNWTTSNTFRIVKYVIIIAIFVMILAVFIIF